MRRKDFIAHAYSILDAINDTKLRIVLDSMLVRREPNNDIPLDTILFTYQNLLRHTDKFSKNEHIILSIFRIENLLDNNIWTSILAGEKEGRNLENIHRLRVGVIDLLDYLPGMIGVVKQNNVDYITEVSDTSHTTNIPGDRQVISLILPESDNEISKPQRLVEAIDSINSFYTVVAILENENPNDLGVAAMDSGSDKSFDFLGAAKVVTAVKELIIELWDRIVYYKERKLGQHIELIGKSLPVFEKITTMENSGKISKEQAEICRRAVKSGVTKFVRVGAVLPEFEQHSTNNPRQIMAPERKLLGYPSGDGVATVSNKDSNPELDVKSSKATQIDDQGNNLTDEEMALLENLLRRSSKSNNLQTLVKKKSVSKKVSAKNPSKKKTSNE